MDHSLWSGLRLAEYRRRWGAPLRTAARDIAGQEIEVHTFASPDEPFQVLITDGLSDTQVEADVPRTELIWYVPEALPVHHEWLWQLARVHLTDALDLFACTLPMAEPLAPGSGLTSVTVVMPPLERDQAAFPVQGAETYTLWVLPLHAAERAHLEGRGKQFHKLLAEMLDGRPFVLDVARASYL